MMGQKMRMASVSLSPLSLLASVFLLLLQGIQGGGRIWWW